MMAFPKPLPSLDLHPLNDANTTRINVSIEQSEKDGVLVRLSQRRRRPEGCERVERKGQGERRDGVGREGRDCKDFRSPA
jgi:hypothetical protein